MRSKKPGVGQFDLFSQPSESAATEGKTQEPAILYLKDIPAMNDKPVYDITWNWLRAERPRHRVRQEDYNPWRDQQIVLEVLTGLQNLPGNHHQVYTHLKGPAYVSSLLRGVGISKPRGLFSDIQDGRSLLANLLYTGRMGGVPDSKDYIAETVNQGFGQGKLPELVSIVRSYQIKYRPIQSGDESRDEFYDPGFDAPTGEAYRSSEIDISRSQSAVRE
jgi:hypothetical protein